jgi:hypothetical protein
MIIFFFFWCGGTNKPERRRPNGHMRFDLSPFTISVAAAADRDLPLSSSGDLPVPGTSSTRSRSPIFPKPSLPAWAWALRLLLSRPHPLLSRLRPVCRRAIHPATVLDSSNLIDSRGYASNSSGDLHTEGRRHLYVVLDDHNSTRTTSTSTRSSLRKSKTTYSWGFWSYLEPSNHALRSVCYLLDISKRPLDHNYF